MHSACLLPLATALPTFLRLGVNTYFLGQFIFTYVHVGRALCLESRVSWVRVPPRAAPFSFEKEVVLVGIALFVMHLPCTLDSCKIPFNLEFEFGLITPVCSYILSEGFSVLSMP